MSGAWQHAIEDLPDDALLYLLGSRYCDVQELSETAWEQFSQRKASRIEVQMALGRVGHGASFTWALTPTPARSPPPNLSAPDFDDGSQVGPLLDQVGHLVASFTGDSALD